MFPPLSPFTEPVAASLFNIVRILKKAQDNYKQTNINRRTWIGEKGLDRVTFMV